MFGLFKWANAHKERLATLSLILGFVVDIITFRNIDLSLSQIILGVHLAIVAGTILILAIPSKEKKTFFSGVRAWLPVLQQYSMGNLFSAFLVLYSASGSIMANWPFLALVAVAILGNEGIKLQKYRLPFQTTLFFLNLLLYTALAVPIAANHIGVTTFVLSVVVASIVFIAFVRLGRIISPMAFKKHWRLIRVGWVSVSVCLFALYFTNVIPPIPLSVKMAHVYHSVELTDGTYTVVREVREPWWYLANLTGETLHLVPGQSAYILTSVFAPANFAENVVHHWQFYDEINKKWKTQNTIHFPIVGGRQGGYRGFSLTQNPSPGKWRISIETVRGQVIGRTYLSVERVLTPPETELYTL